MVWEIHRVCSIPILGMGGIWSARDALEFMVCGATAVQVGTANFVKPGTAAQVVRGMAEWCDARGIERVGELVGTLRA